MVAADSRFATCTSSWGETPIQAASHLGHRQLIWHLLECGAQLDLFVASAIGDLKAAKAALADTPRDACGVHGLPTLHFAVASRDVEVVTQLLGVGVAVIPRRASISPLHSAVAVGLQSILLVLLAEGADPLARDAFGATPLDWACRLYGTGSSLVRILAASSAKPVPAPRPTASRQVSSRSRTLAHVGLPTID